MTLELISPIIFTNTAWKVSKYGVFSGPYFPEIGLNKEILYGPEKTDIWTIFPQCNTYAHKLQIVFFAV